MTRLASLAGRLIHRWQQFWFEEIPPDTYAVLRILIGTVGLIGILGLVPVSTFWTPEGLIPVSGNGAWFRTLLLEHGLGTAFGWALFVWLLASFSCMTVGVFSGWAVALSFFGSVLQGIWNDLPLSGVHDVLVAILFCLLWADTRATLSVDAWLARRRKPSRADRGFSHAIWPLRLIQFQVALIYLNTGLSKLFGPTWRDGSAIHYVLDLNTFQRFPYVLPPDVEWLATIATYVTISWEIAFAFLLFHPVTRAAALVLGVLLHLGMLATLELGLFGWVMIASYVAFLSPSTVSRLVSVVSPWHRRRYLHRSDREAVVA